MTGTVRPSRSHREGRDGLDEKEEEGVPRGARARPAPPRPGPHVLSVEPFQIERVMTRPCPAAVGTAEAPGGTKRHKHAEGAAASSTTTTLEGGTWREQGDGG